MRQAHHDAERRSPREPPVCRVRRMGPGGPERTREYRNHHLDSTRWDGFVVRDDDIFITTAYKAGTTWTQRILAALVFGPQPLPARLGEISPWVDARFMGPLEPILAGLEEQRHR